MSKRFSHLGEDWEASGTGIGHGVGFGFPPPVDRWGVVFRSVANPDRGDYGGGSISKSDPSRVSEAELRRILEERLVLAAINRSRYVWRPAEAISHDTGIPIDRVLEVLDNADGVVSGPRNQQGLWLYTTREHLSKTTSPAMREFFEVRESS